MIKIRELLRSVWNEFIYGGHLLSLGAAGIVWSVVIILEESANWQILVIAYLISQIIYNYDHSKKGKKDLRTNPERTKHLQKTEKWFLFIFLFYLLLCFSLLVMFANLSTFLFALFLMITGVFYTDFFKKITGKMFGFKNFYVALLWAAGSLLPLFYYSYNFNWLFVLFFFYIFLRSYLNAVFFDIKDMEDDKTERLKTLPIIFGKEATLRCLYLVNLFSFLPLFVAVYLEIFPVFALFLTLFFFHSFYYLKKARNADLKKIRHTSYIMVDGEDILSPLVLIAGKLLLSYNFI